MNATDPFSGFYAAYMSGRMSLGLAMFVFRDGIAIGSDSSGVLYDGHYILSADNLTATINATVRVPSGIQLVQGLTSPPGGMEFPLNITIPTTDGPPYFTVETPAGPVNVRLVRLRGFN